MATIHIQDAKTHFLRPIKRALAGEEIIVARGNTPLIKLVPLPGTNKERQLGLRKGVIQWIAPNFDEPVDEFKDAMR